MTRLVPLFLILFLQADPKKEVEEALAAGRLEDASRLLERLRDLDPAVLKGLQSRLEKAWTAQALRASFAAGRDAALARVKEAGEAVAHELREEAEREGRIAAALKELSARTPLKVQMPGNVVLEDVRVAAYTAGRVRLSWPQGELEVPLEGLPEETRALLLTGALAKATPRDHFEIGKLLVHGGDYERAGCCFATAAKRDPALAPFVPDLERVKKASKLFEGSFKAAGSTLSIRWGFSSADEGRDFLALQGSGAVRPGRGLEVEGEKVALVSVKEIPFRDRVKVSALAKETPGMAHLLGLRFVKPNGGEVLIYGALATSLKAFLVMKVEDGQSRELLAPTPGAAGNRMTMDFNRGRFVFQVGDRVVWTGNEGGFTEVAVILGASALKGAGAAAAFRELTLLGGVNPLWMGKKTAGYRDALSAELSKEHQAKGASALAGTNELSVDLLVARANPALREVYAAALETVDVMRRTRLITDLALARTAMERVTAADGAFAPAWYFRGVLEDLGGNARVARGYYDRALVFLEDFPEALCARAFLHALDGEWPNAREFVDQALKLKPDLPEAHLLLARLRKESGDLPGALEAARTARRLAPLDAKVRSHAQLLANVIRGPSWARANAHETANYVVRSDLATAKCRLYAEHLEAMRGVYADILGRSPPAGKRAQVLVFNAAEGYYGYMDSSAGDRQEHTLGAFSSWNGQMALFDDVDAAETLRVLSHEGFHQFLHAIAPDVPIWFNEGMGEYAAATRVEKGKVLERGGVLADRLDNLKAAVRYGWVPVPFDKIMIESQAEFYAQHAALRYAQAWSMVRFFIHGDGGRRAGLMKAYIARLLEGDGAAEAYAAAFGGEDPRALEAAWRTWTGLDATPVRR